MKIAKIQFYPWDNRTYDFSTGDYDLEIGDKVIAKTELGFEIGDVKDLEEPKEVSGGEEEIRTISRLASKEDIKNRGKEEKEKKGAKKYCKEMAKELNLSMKIVDAFFTFDGRHIIFTFIADSRVDFRELVKVLTRHFQKTIRMQQIGIRDEAKAIGGVGVCGRELCCRKVLKVLTNIRSDLVKLQQLENKTSDRLSGACGRLMCCLAYEQKTYEECSKGLPPIGTQIKYDGKKGVIIARHILKRAVRVKDQEGLITEVEIDKLSK